MHFELLLIVIMVTTVAAYSFRYKLSSPPPSLVKSNFIVSAPIPKLNNRWGITRLFINTNKSSQSKEFIIDDFNRSQTVNNVETCTIANKIQKKFDQYMKKTTGTADDAEDEVPLFRDFQTYAQSLPVRHKHPLYQFDYFARPQDLQRLTYDIDVRVRGGPARAEVKYLTAPSGYGKTTSVLPAFVNSNTATHYLYLAFHNNNGRCFKSTPVKVPTEDEVMAEKQGAAFIAQCVKNLLERPNDSSIYEVPINMNPPTANDSLDELDRYLKKKLGENALIWFHIDEHKKMCDRLANPEGGAGFSRGAMSTLARLDYVRIIATYTEPPLSISAMKSSEVCRFPVALPSVDINQAMKKVKELHINDEGFNADQRRLLATIKFRLGMKVRSSQMNFLHKGGENPAIEEFLCDFKRIAARCNDRSLSPQKRTEALKECNYLCDIDLIFRGNDPDAAKLLLGFPDDANSEELMAKRFSNTFVITSNNLVTADLDYLLTVSDPNYEVYNTGRNLLRKYLQCDDLLYNSPLESAYYWAIACHSALHGCIEFKNVRFNIKCKALKKGRLFNSTDPSHVNVSHLEKGIMYYADAVNDKLRPPCGNLFFISDDNELVLVDITGGGSESVKKKIRKLKKCLPQIKEKFPQYELIVVVLAPNMREKSCTNSRSGVAMVCGEDAVNLLGGLSQIMPWLECGDADKDAIV